MELDTLAGMVSLEARASLGRLLDLGPLGGSAIDAQYADLCGALESRPAVERYEAAMLQVRATIGGPDAADARIERDAAREDLVKRFPREWDRRFKSKRSADGRGAGRPGVPLREEYE